MNRYGLVIIAVAVVLLAAVAWNPAQQYAGFQSLLPGEAAAPSPTTTPMPSPTPEPSPSPTPEGQQQPAAKCFDGSPLTVTSRDSNQTNYRCESGAEGAYLNR